MTPTPDEAVSRRSALKTGAVALCAAVPFAGAASADGGERTIDSAGEYALEDDVACEGGTCIRIEADGVTLDGQGHAVGGEGEIGVSVMGDDVTLRNLTVAGFDRGVACRHGEGLRIENCTVRGNAEVGVELAFSGAEVVDSTVRDNGTGVSGLFSRARIADSAIEDNDGRGTTNREDFEVEIEDSAVTGNGDLGVSTTFTGAAVRNCEISDNGGSGVRIGNLGLGGSTAVPVVGNEIRNNGGAGVALVEAGVEARRNDIEGNAVGFRNESDGRTESTLRHNNLVDNEELAVEGAADAECNWWGDADGPDEARIRGDVDYTPWVTERIEVDDPDCTGSQEGREEGNGGGTEPVRLDSTITVRRADEGTAADYAIEARAGIVEGSRLVGENKVVTDPPTTSSGTVGPDNEEDWYWFDGETERVEVDGPAELYVDGELVRRTAVEAGAETADTTSERTKSESPAPQESTATTASADGTDSADAPGPAGASGAAETSTPTGTPTQTSTPTPTPGDGAAAGPAGETTTAPTEESPGTVEAPGFGWIAGGGGLVGTVAYLLTRDDSDGGVD